MTFAPHPLVDYPSLIAARAIHDDAFDPSFSSVKELLHRPILEDVNYVPLPWKEGMLDRPIFHITNGQFYALWHRAWLVSGSRGDPRSRDAHGRWRQPGW